ncbi:MAG TPA: hypothetical protein VK750_00140 [Cytophagaceae bacterium]|nr:hypothetical protein [Cytophagaceae bacterium]
MIFALLVCFISFAGQSFAQQGSNNQGQSATPEQKAQRATAHLQKKLGLSQDQASQMYNITLAHINKMQGLKSQKASGQKGLGDDVKQERANYDNAIGSLLTPAQQQTWTQLKAEQQAKHDARKQNGGKPSTGNSDPNYDPTDYSGGNHN